MSLYDKLASTADKLLKKFGQSATLISVGESSYDTSLRKTTKTKTNYSIFAALLPFTPEQDSTDSSVAMAEAKCYLSSVGLPVRPRPGDFIQDAQNTKYSIVKVDAIAPSSGTVVIYEILLSGVK